MARVGPRHAGKDFVSMLFPVYDVCALAAGVPACHPKLYGAGGHAMVGNSMQVATFVLVQLAVFSHVELPAPDSLKRIVW